MFCLNKTSDWLNSLPLDKRNSLLEKTRKKEFELRMKYKERIREIESNRRESLKRKRILIEKNREQEEFIKRESLISFTMDFGNTRKQQTALNNWQKRTVEKSTECQLQLRKIIPRQQADKTLFFSLLIIKKILNKTSYQK